MYVHQKLDAIWENIGIVLEELDECRIQTNLFFNVFKFV